MLLSKSEAKWIVKEQSCGVASAKHRGVFICIIAPARLSMSRMSVTSVI